METKNTTMHKSKRLLIHHLLEKKNWALLTLIVLIVTVVVLPILAETRISEEYITIGIVEVFIVILINCFIDFSYLHDNRKFGYYMTKPLSGLKRIHMILISNGIFALLFMGLLVLVSVMFGLYLKELFLIPISWLIILMLLTALSSLLSGNTIIAGIATAFNFGIPILILGVIYFAMDIVSDIAIGINTDIIMQFIVVNVYKLDIIYLIKYYQDFSMSYFLVMGIICAVIYAFIRWTLKHRKNERIDEFVLFKGYKYFIALISSVMVPFVFSQIMGDNEYVTKLIVFVILGSLTYYIALIVLEKSFKMKKLALKLLVIFMILFVGTVLLAGGIAKIVESDIPETDDISEILIISRDYVHSSINDKTRSVQHLDLKTVRKSEVYTFKTDSNKELITDIHRSIIDNPNYKNYIDLNIIYFLKDGSQINRYFDLNYSDDKTNDELHDLLFELIKTKEFKNSAYPILYDDAYRNSESDFNILVAGDSVNMEVKLTPQLMEQFVFAMKKDIDIYETVAYLDFGNLGVQDDYYTFNVQPEMLKEDKYDYLHVMLNYGDDEFQGYNISYNFIHTREFLKNLID